MDKIILKADFNLRESIKNIGEYAPRGQVVQTEDYLLTTVGLDTGESHANAVFSLDDSNPEKIFKEANEFFKEKKFDYIFWILEGRDKNMENYLKKLGYEPSREEGTPLMITDHKLALPTLNIDIDVKKVDSQDEINDFIKVVNHSFEIGEEVVKSMFSSSMVLNSKESEAYLLYHEHQPVSGVQIYKTEDIVGIYWVATIDEVRGKGLGKYISVLGTNKAFDMGAKKVILQASRLGKFVYDKIGYDLTGYYRTYKIENRV